MANNKTFTGRIKLKFDTLTNWETLNPTLLDGEIAGVKTKKGEADIIMLKMGPGAFKSLDWVYAPASDVEAWAKKTEEDFIAWVKTLIDLSGYYTKEEVNAQHETINKAITAEKERAEKVEGSLTDLVTTDKTSLVAAINENANKAAAQAVTIEEGTHNDYAKVYTVKQGTETVGTINIPKDMVVQSGEVVINPEGQDAGTYIKLTLANATNDVIYVNVGTLVDIYKAKANATEIQVAVDSATREISATIVNGSVTTEKVADGAITLAKLAEEVIEKLNKADTAIQTVATGTGLTATVDETDATKVTINFDDAVEFIFDCGTATITA